MGEKVVSAVRQVVGFLIQGMNFETDTWRSFEREVKAQIAPQLPALAHRRASLLEGEGEGRWSDDLGGFMRNHLWPSLGDADRDYAERNRTFVTLLLDVTIAAEQRRMAGSRALPLGGALDANWAS
jgi:hypothetical protein